MNSKNCYCAFCKAKRKVSRKKHLSLSDIFYALILSTLLMFLVWQEFNPRVAMLFALIVGISEYIIQIRWRLQMTCPKCGFDPITYMREPEKAVKMVKIHLERWENSPQKWLQANPKKNLYHRKRSELTEAEKQLLPVDSKPHEVQGGTDVPELTESAIS